MSADRPSPGRLPLGQVEHWVFDLDNTLYPASCDLFSQIDWRMTAFIGEVLGLPPEEARPLQKALFRKYGYTLRGLMLEHGVPPTEFLEYVHDIDYAPVPASAQLARALKALPGEKLIFTNGTVRHAEKVLERLGLDGFRGIFDIVAAGYTPKPDPVPYDLFVKRHGIDPRRSAMVEDIARNLVPAAALGMTTVWVAGSPDWAKAGVGDGVAGDHIHHVTDDLPGWLEAAALQG
ncbi:pyrimidine 5'-nucleotidase [Oceanibaculum pacificum]|uniref:HAD family hydrolase n=1 Tax=Oceanibaculum pacificum TaxID=580166 RepID=A0A154VYI8_9PROT|nr:pyrimidine 5'-nucleotidase [Oceanibaculum pacificum]KZD06281.1 HAD family hydrolase [Oceanibaculum pacificum]